MVKESLGETRVEIAMRGRIYQAVNGWPGWPSFKSVMVHDRCIHEEWRYIHCLALAVGNLGSIQTGISGHGIGLMDAC